MPQKQLAQYAQTSVWTIQEIELRRLELSPGLAFRISKATGVDYTWLMENDLSRPPVNQHNKPYSEEDLIRAQDKRDKGDWPSRLGGKMELAQAYYILHLIWEKVSKNADELSFFLFRLKKFLETELSRLPEPPGDITKESVIHVSMKNGTPESAEVYQHPSLFPLTPRSFEIVRLDVDECERECKEHFRAQGNKTSLAAKPRAQTKARRASK